jgi:hypothetical protein
VKQLTSLTICVAFGLVLDRGFNHGQLTVQLAAAADDAKHWTERGAGKMARGLYRFSL